MKVAYVTTYDPSEISNWSGSGYFMAKALAHQSIEVVHIGPLKEYGDRLIQAKELVYKYVARKNYRKDREPKILFSYADQVAGQLKSVRADIVFSPGTIPICYLECRTPIVFWTDATVAGMINFYQSWSNLCRESLTNANNMEQAALSHCRLAIYSSDWAARTAKDNYEVEPSKVKVVPFGANIECYRDLQDIRRLISKRSTDVCKLLFMGVNWYRKGGDLAVELATALNSRGLKTELTIVGCTPSEVTPDFVSLKGFISKTTKSGQATIDNLLAESHYLVLPTRADCVPVVIAEANSFGVPVVTSNVGGIPTVVNDGINGAAFDIGNFVDPACDFILNSLGHSSAYSLLAESSFGHYQDRLNWQVAGKKVKQFLEGMCAS